MIDNFNELARCRVCGATYADFPWNKNGEPSYDICLCCFTQFGVDDLSLSKIRQARRNWLKKGGTWHQPDFKPAGLTLDEQLRQIPKKYL